ncbi:4'-phosphopantetheinyl transferase family protein [Streptomyces sp. NPDC048257]|uniref:4'-phosphopantetheinyl transferase family protein n=1 Tax=Streptomyces sp. NPDC048257 TaxID=3365526 RepID=UPI003717B663
MAPTRPAGGAPGAPLFLQGPDGPWEETGDRLEEQGHAVLCTTWGQWLTAVLLDPALRPLLGNHWPRFRQTPAAAGRIRFAVSHFVMKYAAATALDVPVHALEAGHGPHGRPVLRGPGAAAEVALAHCGELIVVGVSRTGPVGVHAEPADRDLRVGPLREQVCTPQEAAALDALPEGEHRAHLLRLWTLKEACAGILQDAGRPARSTYGLGRDDQGRTTLTGTGRTRAPAGEWTLATHLVQGRYLIGEAHRTP